MHLIVVIVVTSLTSEVQHLLKHHIYRKLSYVTSLL